MSKIEIELPLVLREFLEGQVQAELYESVEAAAAGAISLAAADDETKLVILRGVLARGLADLDAGRLYEGTIDDIIAEARAKAATKK